MSSVDRAASVILADFDMDIGIDALPARVLYERVFPDVVAEHCDPPIPYHRGSPYGGKGWDTSDPTIGDVHQWNIWGGKEWPWQEYPSNGGRFVRCVCVRSVLEWIVSCVISFIEFLTGVTGGQRIRDPVFP